MARQRAFDQDAATDAAVDVFWSRGFAGATPAVLEEAMGIRRSSLYNTFGSKRELYQRALERYVQEQTQQVARILDSPGATLPRLRAAIEHVVRLSIEDADRRGCLVTNAVIERDQADEEIGALLRSALHGQAAAFEMTIAHGQATGEVRADVHARSAADLLLAVLNGVRVLARIDPSEERLSTIADTAVLGLLPISEENN